MFLSFPKANLVLRKDNGSFVVTREGKELLRTASPKKALVKYNEQRKALEATFPPAEFTDEEKAALRKQSLTDSLLDHNSFRPQEKRRRSGSTRTFG